MATEKHHVLYLKCFVLTVYKVATRHADNTALLLPRPFSVFVWKSFSCRLCANLHVLWLRGIHHLDKGFFFFFGRQRLLSSPPLLYSGGAMLLRYLQNTPPSKASGCYVGPMVRPGPCGCTCLCRRHMFREAPDLAVCAAPRPGYGKTQTHNLSGFRKQVIIRGQQDTRGPFSRDECRQQQWETAAIQSLQGMLSLLHVIL